MSSARRPGRHAATDPVPEVPHPRDEVAAEDAGPAEPVKSVEPVAPARDGNSQRRRDGDRPGPAVAAAGSGTARSGVTSAGRRPAGASSTVASPAAGTLVSRVAWTTVVGGAAPVLAAALSAAAGHWPGAVVCAAVAVGVVAWDRRAAAAERTVRDALTVAVSPRVRVVPRGGEGPAGESRASAVGLAAGDTVALGPGDVVPLTGRVVAADGLLADDLALVGDAPAPRRCAVGDVLREGTVVLRGHGRLEIAAAPDVEEAPLATGSRRTGRGPRATRRTADRRRLVAVTVALATVGVAIGVVTGLLREDVPAGALSAAAVLAVLVAPAVAARAATLRRAELSGALLAGGTALRAPDVLDRIAAVDLLAVGSPATLSADRETVLHVWTSEGPVGDLARTVSVGTTGLDPAAERGLAEWAAAMGVDVEAVRAGAPQVSDVPYDGARRRVTTAHDDPAGILVVCKGAPDAVWPLLVTSADGKSFGAAAGRPVADRWTAEGLRVIAVATTRRTVAGNTAGRLEAGLRLVGLIALDGRAREGAEEAVASLRTAGVDVALVTPDHEATALSRARRVGISTARRGVGIVTGDALRTGHWADDARILARMAPEQHRDAVARWRSAGHAVGLAAATTAQIPAVRLADVGIALEPCDEAVAVAADVRVDRPDLGAVGTAVAVARRSLVTTRLLLGLAVAALAAVVLAVLVGALTGDPWLWPGQAALVAVAATVPAVVASRDGGGSELPPGGRRPATGLVDTWWALWVSAWGVGVGAVAVLAGAVAVLAGAPPEVVTAPVVGGALAGAAVTGARVVRGSRAGRGATGWLTVAAVALLGLVVLAGLVWAGGDGGTGAGVALAAVVALLAAAAGAAAALVRPHA